MEFFSSFPVTSALIGANLVASLFAFTNRDFFDQNVFRVGNILRRNEYHRALTSGFLHVDPFHLLMNMYVLWVFGPVLENPGAYGLPYGLGATGFAIVYFGALLGASAWMLWDKRNQLNYSAVGASGAISGVVLAFCLFYPFSRLTLFFAIPMPALVFGIGYLALSFFLSRRDGTMVAHGAHLGGALAGIAFTVLVSPDVLGYFLAQLTGG